MSTIEKNKMPRQKPSGTKAGLSMQQRFPTWPQSLAAPIQFAQIFKLITRRELLITPPDV
jgi:hypothetical protein